MIYRIFKVVVDLVFVGFVFCLGLPMTWAQGAIENPLPTSVSAAMRSANLPDDALGVVVLRQSDGATVVAHHANVSFAPASTMKLVSTFIGLDRLGPIYRGSVEMHTNAQQVGSVLKGDVVLRGLADMDFDWEVFQRMLQTLRNNGIDSIDGNLLVDRHFYLPARLDIGLPPFDESPEFRYNVIPDALNLNLNLLQLNLTSTENGLRIRLTPELDRVNFVSRMAMVDRACKDWEDGWVMPTQTFAADGSIEVQLQGTFPKNCLTTTHINVIDRADYTARLFKSLWSKLGGTFGGQVIESSASIARGQILAEHRSRPLGEIVRDINKPSDNTFARMLYLNIGTVRAADIASKNNQLTVVATTVATPQSASPTLVLAGQEVRNWFVRQGINDDGLVMENGSGLSRLERIRPSQLAGLLRIASQSNWSPEFMASLPIAGLDGTMRNRLRNSPAAGRARLKTGSLRDVASVAGYVPDAAGQMCIVVAFINHPSASSAVARPVLDTLIDWVAKTDTRGVVQNEIKRDWLIEQMKM